MPMTIVIPMAGRSQRFYDAGFSIPKYLLRAHGKTLLQWSVDSLPLDLANRTVFVGLRQHETEHGVEQVIRSLYGAVTQLDFLWLGDVTGGQAETVLRAAPLIDPEGALMVFNIDTAFVSRTLRHAVQQVGVDGIVGCFRSNEPRFSYARTDISGRVVEVAEKDVISPHALTGLYHFGRASHFLAAAEAAVRDNRRVKGEFYVAPLYNHMIDGGLNVVLDEAEQHAVLGTPQEYDTFKNSAEPFSGGSS